MFVPDEDASGEEDLYAVLNLGRDASQEDIKAAFRRLSLVFHPDKQSDPGKRQDAQILFQKIKKAFDILSHPQNKILYDNHGMEGLKMTNMEVVVRGKTTAEVLAEYEVVKERVAEMRLLRHTHPTTDFLVSLDMTDLFDRYLQEDPEDRVMGPQIYVEKMGVSQSLLLGMTKHDSVNLGGSLAVHNGTGDGACSLGWKRQLSPWLPSTYVDSGITYSMNDGFSTDVSVTHPILPTLIGSLGLRTAYNPYQSRMSFHPHTSIQWHISKSITGTISATTNKPTLYQSLTWHASNDLKLSVFCNIAASMPHVGVRSSYKLTDDDTFLDASFQVHTSGPLMKIGVRKLPVSSYTSLSGFLWVGLDVGTLLRLKMSRGTQEYSMPIRLSDDVDPIAIVYGTAVPIVLYWVLRRFVFDPWKARSSQEGKEEAHSRTEEEMARSAHEARVAQDLMRQTGERIRAQEETKGGLVILRALYGHLGGDGAVVDVTLPLQIMVESSRLQLPPCLPPSSRAHLQGFHDPCPSQEKALYISYLFLNQEHEVTVKDSEPLAIPMKKHGLPSPQPT